MNFSDNSFASVASVVEIRAHFPALKRRHNDFPAAYFDGPGGTQVPLQVTETITDYLLHHNANAHWSFPTSNETDEIVAHAREVAADFLHAAPHEIVFGANMTTLTFHLARTLGRTWQSGDEIIVTELDHHANVDTWRSLEKDRGIVIRLLPMDIESGQLELSELPALFNHKTRLLAIGAASNALGTVNDVQHIVQVARERNVLTFVDAVHFAPHALVDVQEIGCDFLACSAYKFYGPHVGLLYGRRELLQAMDFPKLHPAPSAAPDRAETGTGNFEGMAGTAAAIEFLASLTSVPGTRREKLQIVFDELHRRGDELLRQMWHGLAAVPGVRVYGPTPDLPHTPTLSFTVKGHASTKVAQALAARGVFVSHGNFYAATVAERLQTGSEGFVRAGCACYTTADEVERLVQAVRDLCCD
jgi:cysteine desulfurase family protein (TIGR01976 family)